MRETLQKASLVLNENDVEIIVVNDGDSDLDFVNEIHPSIRLVNNAQRGVSVARNLGASMANADLLFFIDDDIWINADVIQWILANVDPFVNPNVYLINWRYPPGLNDSLKNSKIGKYILAANYNCMWGRMHAEGKEPSNGLYLTYTVASCSLLISRSVFQAIGGYNEGFVFQGEDIELSHRLHSRNIKVYEVFDCCLLHNHSDRMDLDGFLARLERGYKSQFQASERLPYEATGNYPKKMLMEFLRSTEPFWIFIHHRLPGYGSLDFIHNKIIGMLAGLQKYKQWKIHQ